MQGSRIFVAGFSRNAAGNDDFLVRAYDARHGDLLWEDQFDKAGDLDGAAAIAVQGRRVFAAGEGTNAAGNLDFLVRAYNAR